MAIRAGSCSLRYFLVCRSQAPWRRYRDRSRLGSENPSLLGQARQVRQRRVQLEVPGHRGATRAAETASRDRDQRVSVWDDRPPGALPAGSDPLSCGLPSAAHAVPVASALADRTSANLTPARRCTVTAAPRREGSTGRQGADGARVGLRRVQAGCVWRDSPLVLVSEDRPHQIASASCVPSSRSTPSAVCDDQHALHLAGHGQRASGAAPQRGIVDQEPAIDGAGVWRVRIAFRVICAEWRSAICSEVALGNVRSRASAYVSICSRPDSDDGCQTRRFTARCSWSIQSRNHGGIADRSQTVAVTHSNQVAVQHHLICPAR
jgi:hypothetical protein